MAYRGKFGGKECAFRKVPRLDGKMPAFGPAPD